VSGDKIGLVVHIPLQDTTASIGPINSYVQVDIPAVLSHQALLVLSRSALVREYEIVETRRYEFQSIGMRLRTSDTAFYAEGEAMVVVRLQAVDAITLQTFMAKDRFA
jgi:hypothetical protein